MHVIHAGTKLDDEGKVVSAGGRVLAVVALGTDLVEARERAYDGVELVQLDGGQFRTDIGGKAARGENQGDGPRRGRSCGESEGLIMNATESSLPAGGLDTETLDLPGWTHVYSGKVRDLYIPADSSITERFGHECVLVVASDRISAFDHVLASEIPDKAASSPS